MKDKEFWKSKKFWVSVIGAVIPAANAVFGWEIATETVLTIIGPLMSYVIGQGIADLNK